MNPPGGALSPHEREGRGAGNEHDTPISHSARWFLMPVTLTLPYPISANRYWATRAMRQGSQVFATTYVTAEAHQYKATVKTCALLEADIQTPMPGRVELEYWLYPQRPQDWAKRKERSETWDDDVRCLDLDNALKVMLDSLKGVIFVDDKQVRTIYGERMEPDEHGARLVVTISEWNQGKTVVPNLLSEVA